MKSLYCHCDTAPMAAVKQDALSLQPFLPGWGRSPQRLNPLQLQAAQGTLLAELAEHMCSSLSLSAMLTLTLKRVQQVLGCDRVNIWQVESSQQSIVVAESTHLPLSYLGERINHGCFQLAQLEPDQPTLIQRVSDSDSTELAFVQWEMLIRLQARAYMVAPLWHHQHLWGWLTVSESQEARDWTAEEAELLRAVAVHLRIALQQAGPPLQLQTRITLPSEVAQDQSLAIRKPEPTDSPGPKNTWESQHLLQTIVDTFPLAVFWKDQQSVVLGCNQRFADVVGLPSPEAVIGKTDFDFACTRSEAIAFQADDQQVMVSGRAKLGIEEIVTLPTGKQCWLETNKLPLRNQAGQVVGVVGTFQDISDRKRIELELRESDEKFRQLTEVVDAVFWLVDVTSHQQLYVSSAYERVWGRPYQEILMNPNVWMDSIHPLDRDRILGTLSAQLQGSYDEEYRIVRPDGQIRWIHDRAFPVRNSQGEVYRVAGIAEDITDRKQAELERQQLLQELSDFKQALDESALIVITDAKGIITYVNEGFVQLSGYSQAELLGQNHRIMNSGYHPPEFFQDLWTTVLQGRVWRGEVCNRTKNGQLYWVTSTIIPFLNEQGYPTQFLTVRFDITDRKQAELNLCDRNLLLGTISQAQSQFITATNRLVIFEQLLDRLLDLTHSEYGFIGEVLFQADGSVVMEDSFFKAKGTPDATSHHVPQIAWDQATRTFYEETDQQAENLNELNSLLGTVIMTGKPLLINCPLNHTITGDDCCLQPPFNSFLGLPFFQGAKLVGMIGIANRPGGYDEEMVNYLQPFLGTCSNLIEGYRLDRKRRDAEERLYQTNDQLIRATRLKDEFLANMSHELRTPLNAILGMTEGLQEEVFGSINVQQTKSLRTIENSAVHLLSLINDILDVAKIESGQIELECTSAPVVPLCSSSLAFIKQQALKKGIQISTHLPDHLPNLWVDERRIRQVLINLLTNAVKFTPDGGKITLAVSLLQKSRDQRPFLQIAITDTGIGIAAADIPSLFQPFIQIDSALNRQYEGTGLGLALVKQIVELHGGQVGLTSDVGVGSCFTVDLPCDPDSLTAPVKIRVTATDEFSSLGVPVDPLPSDSTPVILLAEDNEANINTIASYLKAKGYCIVLAHNGQEAIAVAQANAPDLILMDIQMPGMDGLEAIQQIRQDPALRDLPIVALTALAMAGDRDRCLAAGATDYLAKPIKLKQLATLIHNLLSSP